MDIKTLKSSLGAMFKTGYTPLIIGKHGIGKTEAVEQWCKENGYRIIKLYLGQMADAGDLIGLQYIDTKDNRSMFTKPAWFPNEDEKVLIFLDELLLASKDMLQSVFQLCSIEKTYNGHKLPSDCYVVAATNPPTEDYDGVMDFQNQAFMDRFIHIHLDPSNGEFLDYARTTDTDPTLIEFLSTQPKLLEKQDSKPFLINYISPSRRAWLAIGRLFKQKLDMSVFKEICVGMVGFEATIAYVQYQEKRYEEIIDANDIINNWSKSKKKLEKMVSNPLAIRQDILAIMSDNVVSYINTHEAVTVKMLQAMDGFLGLIPKDLAFAKFQEIDLPRISEKFGNVLEKSNILNEGEYERANRKEIDLTIDEIDQLIIKLKEKEEK